MSEHNGHPPSTPPGHVRTSDLEAELRELEHAKTSFTVQVHTSDLANLRLDVRQLTDRVDILVQGVNDRVDAHFRSLERRIDAHFAEVLKRIDRLEERLGH